MQKNNILVIRKSGNFYHVFDEDSIILWYLLGYKIVNRKVGYPLSANAKVLTVLEENHIHYNLIISDREEIYHNSGINKYSRLLKKAQLAYEKNKNIDKLMMQINNLNEEQLDRIINFIEEIINE